MRASIKPLISDYATPASKSTAARIIATLLYLATTPRYAMPRSLINDAADVTLSIHCWDTTRFSFVMRFRGLALFEEAARRRVGCGDI